jgi:hypothetical protein
MWDLKLQIVGEKIGEGTNTKDTLDKTTKAKKMGLHQTKKLLLPAFT